MGEASRRGTFEERKASAIKRDIAARIIQLEIERRRPSPKLSKRAGLLAILLASTRFSYEIKR